MKSTWAHQNSTPQLKNKAHQKQTLEPHSIISDITINIWHHPCHLLQVCHLTRVTVPSKDQNPRCFAFRAETESHLSPQHTKKKKKKRITFVLCEPFSLHSLFLYVQADCIYSYFMYLVAIAIYKEKVVLVMA